MNLAEAIVRSDFFCLQEIGSDEYKDQQTMKIEPSRIVPKFLPSLLSE